MLKILLDLFDVNKSNGYGIAPLLLAAKNESARVVQLLLASDDVDVNKTDIYIYIWNDRSVFGRSKWTRGCCSIVASDDIDANKATYGNAHSPLYIAAHLGHADVVRLLLSRGDIDMNAGDRMGRVPLMAAASRARVNIAEMLLSVDGIDADRADKAGYSALHGAANVGCARLVDMLADVVAMLLSFDGIDACKETASFVAPLGDAARSRRNVVATHLAMQAAVRGYYERQLTSSSSLPLRQVGVLRRIASEHVEHGSLLMLCHSVLQRRPRDTHSLLMLVPQPTVAYVNRQRADLVQRSRSATPTCICLRLRKIYLVLFCCSIIDSAAIMPKTTHSASELPASRLAPCRPPVTSPAA
jgi:Ankyrin repeats (3 copies)/Ankyrin repeat